jgi:hypothetical protein
MVAGDSEMKYGQKWPVYFKESLCYGCGRWNICTVDMKVWRGCCERCTSQLWCDKCGELGGYSGCPTHDTANWKLAHPEWNDEVL